MELGNFPAFMLDQKRWMVRPSHGRHKQPFSALESRPFDYEPPEGEEDPNSDYWRLRWNNSTVWASYEQAVSFWQRHIDDVEGLSFVLHPGEDFTEREWLICLDYDGAINSNGEVDPEVAQMMDVVGSYVEKSRSGRGLHQFVKVKCEPFTNTKSFPIGNATIEVKMFSQIAVTGDVFNGYNTLESIKLDFLNNQDFFIYQPRTAPTAFEWSSMPETCEPNSGTVTQLEHELDNWEPCIEGQHGDVPFFAAACHITRHGITGELADELLQRVPQHPPFSAKERAHRLRCAYAHTMGDGTYNTLGVENEFTVLKHPEPEGDKPNLDFGFEPIDLTDLLENEDLKLEFIVEGAFVADQSLFIGGQQKCFKTGVAADFAISMAIGGKFLGRFQCLEQRRSAFFTAEIGQAKAKFLAKSILASKGETTFPSGWIDIIDQIPPFSIDKNGNPVNNKAINGLKRYFDWRKPDIAIFDPLYLAMCGSAVGDMYEIGGVLRHIVDVCQEFEIWPVFCHHARKDASKEFQPMELNDFYGSGVGAFARQWILLSHAEPFADGKAKLFSKIGGSAAGDQGLWRLTIDEGQPDDIMQRTWGVSIVPEDEAESIPEEEIIEALKQGNGLMPVRDVAYQLNRNEHQVEKALRDMLKAGKVMIQSRKFKLIEDEIFNKLIEDENDYA